MATQADWSFAKLSSSCPSCCYIRYGSKKHLAELSSKALPKCTPSTWYILRSFPTLISLRRMTNTLLPAAWKLTGASAAAAAAAAASGSLTAGANEPEPAACIGSGGVPPAAAAAAVAAVPPLPLLLVVRRRLGRPLIM